MDHGGVEIGAILAGRYRVERVLGQGGMGIVVQAMHLQLHQPVAMKFLLPEVLANQQVVQRFLREGQAAVRLKSEHVARVIDVGSLDTGAPYMVLEYLEGADLSNVSRAQLTVGGIVDLMLQACEALAEAHSLGIVHRDIKPANFFITRRPDGTLLLKVLDFGISKAPTTGGQLTATQTVMGTPAYMSPEQMRSSRDVDHRSDIWSLGVVLYELLQGTPPFGGDTFSSMVLKVVTEPLPKLTVALPGDLAGIVYRCLEKDPARRFQNIAELAHAIAKYARSETQAAISVQRTRGIVGPEPPRAALALGATQRALPSTISGSVGAKTMPQRSGRRWPIFAAMGVLAGGIGVVILISSGSRPVSQLPSASPRGTPNPASVSGLDETTQTSHPPIATPPLSPQPPVTTAPIPASLPATTPVPVPVATTPTAPLVPATTEPDVPGKAIRIAIPPSSAGSLRPATVTRQPAAVAKILRKPAMGLAPSAKNLASPTKDSASPAKGLAPPAKPDNPPMKPPSSDDADDPLGTRN